MRITTLSFFFILGLFLTAQSYQVGPGDLLRISVTELEEIANKYRIDNLGYLTLPYLGRIEAKGETVPELVDSITEKLKLRFVNDPHVFVDLIEYNFRPISVIGAVKTPGRLTRLTGNIDLVEAIIQAGGVLENASDRILVMRKNPSGIGETLEISYNELMIQGESYLNIPLYPGDTINIPVKQPLVVSIIGEVNRPGELKFSRNSKITILRVIAASGGFTDYAKRHKILVRRDIRGEAKEFRVNLKAIQSNRQPDFVMEHNDVVIVP